MPFPYKISRLLHLFLDLYEKEPGILEFLLEEPNPFGLLDNLEAAVPIGDQYNLLLRAHRRAREEVLAKTLIQTSSLELRHEVLRERLDEFQLDSTSYESTEEKYRPLPEVAPLRQDVEEEFVQEFVKSPGTPGRLEELLAKAYGISVEEYVARRAGEELSAKKLDSEILRFFADRIDQITSAIEMLDATEFNRLIPDRLITPFRELHINAVLGNFGTTYILCGTLLEQTLQDLLPSGKLLNDLIAEAKADGLLADKYRRYADRIRDDRNNAAHGKVNFDSINAKDAWQTIEWTRKLIYHLYHGRLHKE